MLPPSRPRSRRGETAVQYVLIASLISIGIIFGLMALGVSVSDIWSYISGTVTGAT